MAVKHAKIIDDKDLKEVFKFIDRESNHKIRDKVAINLSLKAGLRVAEIAGLKWEDVTKANGNLSDMIHIGSHIGKGGKERQIPMHKDIKECLTALKNTNPTSPYIRYGDYKDSITPNALTVWFKRIYMKTGLIGCSSHSGRRTFLTKLARTANLHGGSLKDVQLLAGHSYIMTTERYIEPSDTVINMVNGV